MSARKHPNKRLFISRKKISFMKNIFEDAKFGDVFIGADVEEFNMTMARNPLPLGGGGS